MKTATFGLEKGRYSRQSLIKGWNQDKLKAASVLAVGLGGLGSASTSYLAAAGIGKLHLCDGGKVELSNLNRQLLYSEDSIGKYKVEEARNRLSRLNSEIHIELSAENLNHENIERITGECDIILDGVDNHETRLLLNKQVVKKQIPLVYGAILGWQGFIGVFQPPQTACLACIMQDMAQQPTPTPAVGVLPAIIGVLQATEVLKLIMGIKKNLRGRLLILDIYDIKFEIVETRRRIDCPVCSG